MDLKSILTRCSRVALLVLLAAAGCGEAPTDGEPAWGIGGKADDGMCSPDADLCWTSEDRYTVKRVLRLEGDIAMDRVETQGALIELLDGLWTLAHKLREDEIEALAELETSVRRLRPGEAVGALQELRVRLLTRLSAAYHAAHMIPTGQMAEEAISGKADDPNLDDPSESLAGEGYTTGMKESLALLRESGALGHAYAAMLEMSGVLDRDYRVINAKNFGEYDYVNDRIVPKGISREEKVERIIKDYRRLAAFIGAAAGAEALIPIAGVPISIATETYALFRAHARMVFEIAAVYGLDIREGRNLLTVALILINDGLTAEIVDVVASNVLVPIFARVVAKKLAIELPTDLAVRLATRSVSQFLALMTRKGQQALAEAALEGGARGVGSQVLGWVTLGLTIFVSAAVDWYVTDHLGRRAAVSAKRWLHDLMMEGTTYLHRPQARDCAFLSLGAMARADGRVSDREKRLYMAMLAKPYYLDEQSWFFLDAGERIRQSRRLRDAREDPSLGCIRDSFEDSLPAHKLSLLSILYSMMQIDLEESQDERRFYQQIRDLLESRGLFGGSDVNEEQLDYVERAIYILLHPGAVEVAPEYADSMTGILPEETMGFMSDPHPEVESDFRCGYEGVCP